MSPRHPIHLFEEHSSTLPVWWQHRANPRTVIYLDAHLDLQQIDSAQIQALRACDELEPLRALESPHHLNTSSRYAFGIENFLYPASQLKLIERLIWVVPPHIPRQYSSALLEYIQQMEGISFDELTSFKPIGEGILRGTLLGLDITVCDYQHLNKLDISSSYYLDIDIDYFVQVPQDQLWVDPATVISSLLHQLGEPCLTTISRAISSGFTPLSMHFIADYVVDLLNGETIHDKPYPQLIDALGFIARGDAERAVETCRRAIRAHPGFAASHFIHSIAMRAAGNTEDECDAEQQRAIELEAVYAFDLSRAASGFTNRRQAPDTQQMATMSTQIQHQPSDTSNDELAFALLCAQTGDIKQAWELLQKQVGGLSHYCDLVLAIARGILGSETPQQARPLLEIASSSPKTRCSAALFLGELAYRAGEPKRALEHYQRAHEYAPAWMLPLEQKALCLEALGDTTKLNQIHALIAHRKQILSCLSESPEPA